MMGVGEWAPGWWGPKLSPVALPQAPTTALRLRLSSHPPTPLPSVGNPSGPQGLPGGGLPAFTGCRGICLSFLYPSSPQGRTGHHHSGSRVQVSEEVPSH